MIGDAARYSIEHGVRANVVRALHACGPRQEERPVANIVAHFIVRALAGEPIEIDGEGEQRLDLVYVKDLAAILVEELLRCDRAGDDVGRVYEAGTGKGQTVNDIAGMIRHFTGSASAITHLAIRLGEPPRSVVIALHPVSFPYTPIGEGLRETIAWYRARQCGAV